MLILPFVHGCIFFTVMRERAMTDKAIREKNGEFVIAGMISDESGMPIEDSVRCGGVATVLLA